MVEMAIPSRNGVRDDKGGGNDIVFQCCLLKKKQKVSGRVTGGLFFKES